MDWKADGRVEEKASVVGRDEVIVRLEKALVSDDGCGWRVRKDVVVVVVGRRLRVVKALGGLSVKVGSLGGDGDVMCSPSAGDVVCADSGRHVLEEAFDHAAADSTHLGVGWVAVDGWRRGVKGSEDGRKGPLFDVVDKSVVSLIA